MTLTEIISAGAGIVAGGVISFFITKWSMNKQKEDQKDDAISSIGTEIKGSAIQINDTLNFVREHSTTLTNITNLIKEKQVSTDTTTQINETLDLARKQGTILTNIINLIEKDRTGNDVANHVIDILNLVRGHSNLLIEISDLIKEDKEHNKESLSCNQHLDFRLQQKKKEKKIVGQFILQYITTNSCLAIDCGTSAAWAFYEIAKIFKSKISVVTNNIFIPSIFSQEYDYVSVNDVWGVQETPSLCYVTSGVYFPSYGGILKMDDDSIEIYSKIWAENKPDTIIIGCTTFTTQEGPYARSGANRRFKESLIKYALENEYINLFILADVDKIGKRIGDPVSQDIWNKLKMRKNVYILAGLPVAFQEFRTQISPEIQAQISEEVRLMLNQNRQNNFLIIDKNVSEIDIKKHFI